VIVGQAASQVYVVKSA